MALDGKQAGELRLSIMLFLLWSKSRRHNHVSPANMLIICLWLLFVCVAVLWPNQPYGVISSAVNLHNNTFTGQT